LRTQKQTILLEQEVLPDLQLLSSSMTYTS
jgi:hypothetical protein